MPRNACPIAVMTSAADRREWTVSTLSPAAAHRERISSNTFRWSARFCREGRIELVRCYQGFIERLSQAVDQQARAAQAAQAQLERATSVVREHEVKLAALRKVVEQRLADSRRESHRIDQKQSDEFAARVAWDRRTVRGQPNPT